MNGLVQPLFPNKHTGLAAVCSIDTATLALRRYEVGGAVPRLTHKARIVGAGDIVQIVGKFMDEPPGTFAVDGPLFIMNTSHDAIL